MIKTTSIKLILIILIAAMFTVTGCKCSSKPEEPSPTKDKDTKKIATRVEAPPTASELFNRATILLNSPPYIPEQAYTDAINLYKQLLALYPNHALCQRTQYNLAIAIEKKIKYINNKKIVYYQKLGINNFEQIKPYLTGYDDAITQFIKLAEKYPKSKFAAESTLRAANLCRDETNTSADYELAIKYYKQLIEKFKSSGYTDIALYKIGELYEALRKYDEAIKYYKKLIDNYKDSMWYSKASLRLDNIEINK